MDSTATENITGQPGAQEEKRESISAIFDRVYEIFELFAFQTLNLEIIVNELFYTPSHIDTLIVKEFLENFVRYGLMETSKETFFDNAGPLTLSQTTRSFEDQV